MKTPSTDSTSKKATPNETISATTLTNLTVPNAAKNVRGIIHLPSAPITETVDQANQTYSGDFCTTKEEGYDSEEERRVYMKPGSYSVPKKEGNEAGGNGSPRAIEFLETAQNINKAQTANDRYWANVSVGGGKKQGEAKIGQERISEPDLEVSGKSFETKE